MKFLRVMFILLFTAWTGYVISLFHWIPTIMADDKAPFWFKCLLGGGAVVMLIGLIEISFTFYKVYKEQREQDKQPK